ncbi:MAG: BREX-1 system adenine-specific DNA-methyltransferase PglX, partial [Clostridium sp.]
NHNQWFKVGISYTDLTSKSFNGRVLDNNMLFDMSGPALLIEEEKFRNSVMALLNSVVGSSILSMLNSIFHVKLNDIARVPYKELESRIIEVINSYVNNNIKISRQDWNSFETSWSFKNHPLLKLSVKGQLCRMDELFNIWKTECEEKFIKLKSNEEELNRIFIDIYGLQDELAPEVEDKDITIRKADRTRDIKSFISYAVGCMLGRYSIDAEGVTYDGGGFADKWDLENKKVRNIEKDEDGNVVSDSWVEATFSVDADNIIPITEDEYFEDDIVSKFIEFVRTVYSEDNLEYNLDFIAESIGRKASETARQAIRRYFIKDFYKDHLKVYQKRPIYWMFDSGKNDGFKALVYMHRYNEQTVAKLR